MTNLVIVESAAKCKIIEKYLNSCGFDKKFKVIACFGHINGLPLKELGVNKDTWTATYILDSKKTHVIKKLRDSVATSDIVYIASDNDLEGDAIAYHLKTTLKLNKLGEDYWRVTFNEITKNAIKQAFSNPGDINMKNVFAQETRRILDRIVGYELSPILWNYVKDAKSAGRVQSACLNLIVSKFKDYTEHVPVSEFSMNGIWKYNEMKLSGKLYEPETDKEEQYLEYMNELKLAKKFVATFSKKEVKKNPPPPYTTSSLQQDCYTQLRLSNKKTMLIAQELYESGMITYMRTDSVEISSIAQKIIIDYITQTYTETYVRARKYNSKESAQGAHEAIRPTDITNDGSELNDDSKRLYDLIRKRTLASQMAAAKYSHLDYIISPDKNTKYIFKGSTETLIFDGYLRIYKSDNDITEPFDINTDELHYVKLQSLKLTGSFSQPPTLYNESSIIKTLEQNGIGRPSTYVSILDKLYSRFYIQKKKADVKELESCEYVLNVKTKDIDKKTITIKVGDTKKDALIPTDLGIGVIKFLTDLVPYLVNPEFTANMEKELDEISENNKSKNDVLNGFYTKFDSSIKAIPVTQQKVEKTKKEEIKENISVIKSKYGRAIYVKDSNKYINIESFLAWRKQEDMSEKDIQFMLSLPITIPNTNQTIEIGRYGLYIKDGKMNKKLNKSEWDKVYDGDLGNLIL